MNYQKEIVPFLDYEQIDGIEPLYFFRLKIEDAQAALKEIKGKLDNELIRRMKENKITGFESGENKIYYANVKKEKIKDPSALRKLLLHGTDAERDLAEKALAGGQAAWNIGGVRLIQDTLGLDLIETTYMDKLYEVKSVPKKILEGK